MGRGEATPSYQSQLAGHALPSESADPEPTPANLSPITPPPPSPGRVSRRSAGVARGLRVPAGGQGTFGGPGVIELSLRGG